MLWCWERLAGNHRTPSVSEIPRVTTQLSLVSSNAPPSKGHASPLIPLDRYPWNTSWSFFLNLSLAFIFYLFGHNLINFLLKFCFQGPYLPKGSCKFLRSRSMFPFVSDSLTLKTWNAAHWQPRNAASLYCRTVRSCMNGHLARTTCLHTFKKPGIS